MNTRKESFSLYSIVHSASSAEQNDKNGIVESRRYWVTRQGEVLRKKQWMGDAKAYIVVTSEQDGKAYVDFDLPFKIQGSDWAAPAIGRATFSCAQASVLRLLTRWRKLELTPRTVPDHVFYEEFHDILRNAADECSEQEICSAVGTGYGGRVEELISERIHAGWGIKVALTFDWDSRNRLARQELRVETPVRVDDFREEFPALAIVELDQFPLSLLRALASLGRQDEMRNAIATLLIEFYAQLTMEKVVEPTQRATWRSDLEVRINALCAQSFGRRSRLVNISETLPALPGRTDEQVRVALPGRIILTEPEPVDVDLIVKLRMESMSVFLRSMAGRPGKQFNAEFELIARDVAGPSVDRWSGSDLNDDNRKDIEAGLLVELNKKAKGFGYEVTECRITTSLDLQSAEIKLYNVVLANRGFLTSESGISVSVKVSADLTFAPGARQRKSTQKLLDPFVEQIRGLLEKRLAERRPSEIYQYWSTPAPKGSPLQEELSAEMSELFGTTVRQISLTVELVAQVELVEMRNALLKQELDVKGVRLTPENVPGEIVVDVHAFVTEVTEQAWHEMAEAVRTGQNWDPLARVASDLTRLMQENFAVAMESSRGERITRRSVIENLSTKLTNAVQERYHVFLGPRITAYSSPEVVAFFRHEAEERKRNVEHRFELIRAVKAARQQKDLSLIQAIADGELVNPETQRIEESITALQEKLNGLETAVREEQRDFETAMYFVNLLSVPTDESPANSLSGAAAPKEIKSGTTDVQPQPQSEASGAAAAS